MTDDDIAVSIRHLTTGLAERPVHRDCSLDVRRGEILGLIGGSGSGKSFLLRHIAGLIRPREGEIRVGGEAIGGGPGEGEDVAQRRRIGVMFQHGALFGALSVIENVEFPLREHTRLPARVARSIAMTKLALSGFPMDAVTMPPRMLSGGMLKRAAVARALALDPDLLLLDEPTAGLDPVTASGLDEMILELRDGVGLTVIVVTHDLDSLWRVTDRVAFLAEGQVAACAPMSELADSTHPEVRAYFDNDRTAKSRLTYEFAG